MVNIHVFNLNGILSKSEKDQICLLETLKHQSNYKLFIWTEKNKEVQEIISNSDFCKKCLSKPSVRWECIYDYLKCKLGAKYGGWVMELDQVVTTNLGELNFDKNCSYFHKISEGIFCAASWTPIYFKENEDVSQILNKFESDCLNESFAFEFQACQINGMFKDCRSLEIQATHFSEEEMGVKYEFWQDKKILIGDNGEVFLITRKGDGTVDWIISDLDVFIRVAKVCNFFSITLPTIKERGYQVIMNEKAIKAFSEFDLGFGVDVQEVPINYKNICETKW